MTFPVVQTYRKDLAHPPGHGYGRNIGSDTHPIWVSARKSPLSSEVVHTTSNRNVTSIEHEGRFLRDSPDVSCNDLIGRDGTVYIILPDTLVGWHAGVCLVAWSSTRSFGTELHVSLGQRPTQAQMDALEWRMRRRIEAYGIARQLVETHRAIARPVGRKKDPEGWPDSEFYAWRDALYDGTVYRVTHPAGARVRQGPGVSFPIAAVLPPNATFYADRIVPGEAPPGETNGQWAHYWGPDQHTPAALGFVWSGICQEVPG